MASVELSVAARSKASHRVDLSTPGVVTWDIRVGGDLDVGVEILWTPDGAVERKIVMPSLRFGTDVGNYIATTKGSIEFNFDNSYSMLRSKSVTIKFSKRPLTAQDTKAAESYSLDVEKHSAILNRLAVKGVQLFFTNHFVESEKFFEYDRLRVPIYALSWATIGWTKALVSLEPAMIDEARRRLAFLQSLCEYYMPKDNSLLTNIKSSLGAAGLSGFGGGKDSESSPTVPTTPTGKADMSAIAAAVAATKDAVTAEKQQVFTPLQLEAQLVYAEATLLSSLLYLFEESVVGLLKCGMAVRSGWRLYQQADRALGCPVSSLPQEAHPPLGPDTAVQLVDSSMPSQDEIDKHDGSTEHRAVLIDSLAFGMGVFSTLASILPAGVLKVLSALGLPADREAGMAQLRLAMAGGRVRAPLAALMILSMRVLLPSFHTGDVSVHAVEADAALSAMLKAYPDGALFSWMAGRLARMRSQADLALKYFDACASSAGKELVQLEHLCHYEQAGVHSSCGRWEAVLPLHARLAAENAWSKAYYSYAQGVACLQLGRLSEARGHMKMVLKHGASARRLAGRSIPAEQYGVRRAAEFIGLTRIAGEASDPEDDEAKLYYTSNVEGGQLVRIIIPPTMAPGSAAHAAALAYPLCLPGLESVYLFNGFPSMSERCLHGSIRQVDAILGAISGGQVFDLAGRAHAEARGDKGKGGAEWIEADSSTVMTTDALTSLLDSAAGTSIVGLSTPREGKDKDSGSAAGAATPASPSPATPVKTSGGLGGMFGKVGGLVSSVSSQVTSTVATVAGGVSQVATLAAGAAGTALSKAGIPTGPSTTYSPYAVATPPAPVHAVAVAALMRGAACAALGRVDEAAAAFAWVAAVGQAGRLRRDLHLAAYAWYEQGLLYLDAARYLSPNAPAAAPGMGSTRDISMRQHMLSSAWARSQGLTYASARQESVRCMRAAREYREDFNWKVRLGIRVHLAYDELGHSEPAANGDAAAGAAPGTPSKAKVSASVAEAEETGADDDEFAEAAAASSMT